MRVLVCGGRDYTDWLRVRNTMLDLHERGPITEIIHGAAPGADSLARVWAELFGVTQTSVPANWLAHGKAAGPIRNQKMLEMQPDLVVAFPGGPGTADMVERATKAGITVMEVR